MRIATCFRPLLLAAAIGFFAAGACAPSSHAGTLDFAKFVFHTQPWSKAPCEDGLALAAGTDCATYDVGQLPLNTPLHVYLVVASNPLSGLGGMQCGIDYDPDPGSGVDVFSWTSCGALEYSSPGVNGAWPAAGSGNKVIWSECQTTVPSGGSYAQGVAGAFYVYAYSDDVLEATPDRTRICYGELVGGDCAGGISDLMPPVDALGSVGFGSLFGWNPCGSFADGPLCGVSTSTLDFGTVILGDSLDLTVRIVDTAGFGPGLPTFDVGPLDAGDFRIVAGEGHYEYPVQTPVEVTFRFSPLAPGDQEFLFEVDPCTLCPPVTLRGTGDIIVPVDRVSWGEVKARYE